MMDRNGCVIAGVIGVDLWFRSHRDYLDGQWNSGWPQDQTGQEIVRLFFLTHLHADHTVGLDRSWSLGPIFTSPDNVRLAPRFLTVDPSLLVPLELGVPHFLSLGEGAPQVRVTLADSGHVPGSVMILLRGFFGHVLYTGDFRIDLDPSGGRSLDNSRLEKVLTPCLQELLSWEDLDIVYLDNTYLDAKWDFPPRQVVLRQVVAFIRNLPKDCTVFLGARKLGKEAAFLAIARQLQEKICLDRDRFDLFRDIGLPVEEAFTCNPSESRMFIVNFSVITRQFLIEENKRRPTVGLLLTSLPPQYRNGNRRVQCGGPRLQQQQLELLHQFNYSDHSSYPELTSFVELLKPKEVKFIVKNPIVPPEEGRPNDRNDLVATEHFRSFLSSLPKKTVEFPIFKSLPVSIGSIAKNMNIRQRREPPLGNWLPSTVAKVYRGPAGPIYESSSSKTLSTTICHQADEEESVSIASVVDDSDDSMNETATEDGLDEVWSYGSSVLKELVRNVDKFRVGEIEERLAGLELILKSAIDDNESFAEARRRHSSEDSSE